MVDRAGRRCGDQSASCTATAFQTDCPSRVYPLGASRHFGATSGAARMYNDYIWAGPLLLDGSPDWQVSVDGRLYFFPIRRNGTRSKTQRGRISLDALQQKYHPDAFFLFPRNQPLIMAFSRSPCCAYCYSGPMCIAFVRVR